MAQTTKTTSWNSLPLELKSMVLHVADIPSLLNLITADPSINFEFHSSFSTILPSVLASSMPRDLQQLICTFLSIREAGEISRCEVERVLYSSFDFNEKKQLFRLKKNIKRPLEALRAITQTQSAVDYFTKTFATCLCQPPNSQSPNHLPQMEQQGDPPILSATEIHRIQRGLWRYQVCCELSTSWLSCELDFAQSGGADRHSRLMTYLKYFMPWEIEELHCVYNHLENMLERDTQDPRLDHFGNIVNPFAIPRRPVHNSAPIQAAAAVQGVTANMLSQGLSFLYSALHQTPSSTRLRKELTLWTPSDVFITSAIHELKVGQQRFPHFCEFVSSSNMCPWQDNHGANLANYGWRFFCNGGAGLLRTFAYLRQFGFCMWDERRLQSWGVLHRRYGSALNYKLVAI